MASARIHHALRFASLAVLAGSLTYMGQRANLRVDMTSEGLSQITEGTRELIRSVPEDRPVVVTAYISKDVPRGFVPLRSRLTNILREMEAQAGPGLQVRIVEPETYSDEAQEAIDNYGIAPRSVMNNEAGKVGAVPVFLGAVFSSGPREEVIPFFERGLSVEYEVARALRVVTQKRKPVVGVVRTDATIMGNFDINTRRRQPPWQIVEELKKQYEVRSLNPGASVPGDVDIVMVPQISSLTQAGLNNLREHVEKGRPALLVADPYPVSNLRISPSEPMLPPPGQNAFGGGGGPQREKGDYRGFLRSIGVDWKVDRVLYDTDNPNPSIPAPRQVVFAGERATENTFGKDPIVDGLTQVAVLFGGELAPVEGSNFSFDPLLKTGSTAAGYDAFESLVDTSNFLFGIQPRRATRFGPRLEKPATLAARITGGGASGEGGKKSINVIVLSDLDMIGDSFFALHQQGGDLDGDGLIDTRFDNVTFLLNAIDTLVGDTSFVELRKRQQKYRRLERVDDLTKEAREKRDEKVQAADAAAEKQLEEAKAALQASVEAIRNKPGLDERTKQIMMKSAEASENRRLMAKQQVIQRDKARSMSAVESEHVRSVNEVRNRIRLFAVLIPPIPAILLGLFLFARKRRRERAITPESRKRGRA